MSDTVAIHYCRVPLGVLHGVTAISSVPIFSFAGSVPPTLSTTNPLRISVTIPSITMSRTAQIPVTSVSADQVMVLSSALCPMPTKVVGKIKSYQYVPVERLSGCQYVPLFTAGSSP